MFLVGHKIITLLSRWIILIWYIFAANDLTSAAFRIIAGSPSGLRKAYNLKKFRSHLNCSSGSHRCVILSPISWEPTSCSCWRHLWSFDNSQELNCDSSWYPHIGKKWYICKTTCIAIVRLLQKEKRKRDLRYYLCSTFGWCGFHISIPRGKNYPCLRGASGNPGSAKPLAELYYVRCAVFHSPSIFEVFCVTKKNR